MKLVSFVQGGVERAGIIVEDRKAVLPILEGDQYAEPMLMLIRNGLMDRIPKLYQDLELLRQQESSECMIPLEQVKLICPIPHPRDFLCIGLNFQTHAAAVAKERGEQYHQNVYPAYFAKRTWESTMNDSLPYIEGFEDTYEGGAEIAVILGRDALNLTRENVKDFILGYAVHNDLCENEINKHYGQPMQGKSLDGLAPFGPWIVTADEFDEGHVFRISMYIAGRLCAEDTSDHMSFDIPYMVSQLSTNMTLKAGTVIASGSPGEFGDRYYPKSGEDFVCVVEGIGEIRQSLKKAERPTPYADKKM